MNKKLCIRCSNRIGARYMGRKSSSGICECCGKRGSVTLYEVSEQDAKSTASKSKSQSAYRVSECTTITLTVDARTAFNLRNLAGNWNCTQGAVIDSILKNFLRRRKET